MKNHLNNLIVVMNYSIHPLFLNALRIQKCRTYLFNIFQKILNSIEVDDQNKGYRCIADHIDLSMNIKNSKVQ